MSIALTAIEKGRKKLVLFDIDGTLIKSKETGYTTMLLEKYFGVKPYKSKIYGEGKTHSRILKERLEESGFANPEKNPRFKEALEDKNAAEQFKLIKFEKVPYVEDLLRMLLRNGHNIGILTGNTEQMAMVKLDSVNLTHYFSIKACDANIDKRSDLIPIAIHMANEKTGIEFLKSRVYVVGDTIEDIRCGKENGVMTIAVATGKETFGQLSQGNPDFIFKDFRSRKQILSSIEAVR